jgi:hypothetical protein
MATAIAVVDFCELAKASALSRKPMNKLPESPRKMVAGWKLYRKNPNMAPANTTERSDTRGVCLNKETAKMIIVENNAEPAASPSSPSIRLKAFVIRRTQNIVRGRPIATPRAS